jgi:hypothetical protein
MKGFTVKQVELKAANTLTSEGWKNVQQPAPAPANGRAKPSWPVQLKVDALKGLMALIPNVPDLDRDQWLGIGHGLKALCGDDADGFETFNAWSQQWPGKDGHGYDAAKTRTAWDSLGASGLRTAGGSLRARAEASSAERFKQWDASLVFDDGEAPPAVPAGRGQVQFELGAKKEVLRSLTNAKLAITGLGIACSHDEFHHRMHIQHAGAPSALYTGQPSDVTVLMLRVALTRVYGKDFGTAIVWDAVIALARENGFNPVCEMLAEAELFWDGVSRLDRLGPDYFHSEDTAFARMAFRKTLLAAVRRARRPGCKFDQILVVEGPEGWNKSSAWAVLAGKGNFSDAPILGKDARAVQEELGNIWVHEIADLSGLSKAEVEHVKAFASRVNDRARPAYGRALVDQPRQSIEVGTTNADAYLLSMTGNRRFWPCKILQRIDLEKLRRDRLQLWGEAAAAETAGESLMLPEPLWTIAGEEQEKRRAIDTWEAELENLEEIPAGTVVISGAQRIQIVNGEQFITNLSVQEYLGGYRSQHFTSGSGRKIAEIMTRLGWERTRVRIDGKPTRGYVRARSIIWNASGTASGTENLF